MEKGILAFALTFCYTGVGTELSCPYAQMMAKSGEPKYQQGKGSYQQKQMAICDIPFATVRECAVKQWGAIDRSKGRSAA